jgi:hypothetical protein
MQRPGSVSSQGRYGEPRKIGLTRTMGLDRLLLGTPECVGVTYRRWCQSVLGGHLSRQSTCPHSLCQLSRRHSVTRTLGSRHVFATVDETLAKAATGWSAARLRPRFTTREATNRRRCSFSPPANCRTWVRVPVDAVERNKLVPIIDMGASVATPSILIRSPSWLAMSSMRHIIYKPTTINEPPGSHASLQQPG